jgi:hypothetical protein
MANALAGSKGLEQAPLHQETLHHLVDFIAEREEDATAGTIEFTWVEFQEYFAAVQDCLRRIALINRRR